MRIEIKKVEKIVKDNGKKFKELINPIQEPNPPESAIDKYDKLCKLFHCFMGDLYMLFGNEYFEEGGTKCQK